jgi:acyl carrier protein|tara:strand:+ start:37 stop:273 length:237 start_codon:yes stop_codon:yes gene_type:complete
MANKLYEIISKVFDVNISDINDQSSPETVERWDSFHGLALIDSLEIEYDVKFSISEITDVKNIADIKRHLKNHGIEIE